MLFFFFVKFWCHPASCVARTDWAKEQQRQKNLDKQHRISKRNATSMDKPGITTLLNLTVLHYSLAFLDDWLLSFNVFFSYYFLFPCRRFISGQIHKKESLKGNQQLTSRFSAATLQLQQKLHFSTFPFFSSQNALWTELGTLTWFLPITVALSLLVWTDLLIGCFMFLTQESLIRIHFFCHL